MKEIAYRSAAWRKTVAGASASIAVTAEGATTVAYSAKDNAGNVEAEKTLVVRIDKTAPTVTCPANPRTLWPADHKLVPITVTVKVTDGRSGSAGFSLTAVTSNEPDDAPGNADGATTGDITGFSLGTADTSGQLRAERVDVRAWPRVHADLRRARRRRQPAHVHDHGLGPERVHRAEGHQAARQVKKARREYAARLRRGH